jgi:hypothetical protein
LEYATLFRLKLMKTFPSNLACDIEDRRPRLSGRLDYGPPFYWQIEIGYERLEIAVSARQFNRLIQFFVLLAAMTVSVVPPILWRLNVIGTIRESILLASIPAAGLCAGALWLSLDRAREFRLGLRFIYDKGTSQFLFPRQKLQFNSREVVRWDLVFGCWVRLNCDKEEGAQMFGDDIAELQLVIDKYGKRLAIPLLGGLGAKSLDKAATTIADFTGVPLERINEPRTITNPFHMKT